MKKYFTLSMLLLLAFVLTVFISRSETLYNASPCMYNEVCQEKTLGTKKTVQSGFPASYRQVTTFTPQDSSRYGLVDQGSGTNQALIVVDVLFWLAMLTTFLRLVENIKYKR